MSLGVSRAVLESPPVTATKGSFVLFPQGSVSSTTTKNNGGGTQIGISAGSYSGLLMAFTYPFEATVNRIVFNGAPGGIGTHIGNLGIYDLAGKLVAHIGPQTIANGSNDFPFVEGAVDFKPGTYLVAWTGKSSSLATITVEESQGPFIPWTTTDQADANGNLPAQLSNLVEGVPLYGVGDPPDRPIILLY